MQAVLNYVNRRFVYVKTAIALHMNVTVRRVFPDGPAKSPSGKDFRLRRYSLFLAALALIRFGTSEYRASIRILFGFV